MARMKLIGQLTTSVFPLCCITPLISVPVQSQHLPVWDTDRGSPSRVDATDLIVSQLAEAVADTDVGIVGTMHQTQTSDSDGRLSGSKEPAEYESYHGTELSSVEYSICGITSLSYHRLVHCEQWSECIVIC